MKSHAKQLSTGAYTKFSLMSKVYMTPTPEKMTGVRLAPLTHINNKNVPPPRGGLEKSERQPVTSYNIAPSKLTNNPLNPKHNTLLPNPKLPLPIDKPKNLAKKSFLDSSLDSTTEERDLSSILPQSKLLFRGPAGKPRTNIVLTPISQEKEKSNLIRNMQNGNGYIVKKRMRSVGPKHNDSSFLSEKGSHIRQHHDFVPPLNIPSTTSNSKVVPKQTNSNALNTDRTHSKQRKSFSPRMSRKGSEPSRLFSNDRPLLKKKFIQEHSHFDESSTSPGGPKKFHKRIATFLAEIDKSLSVESGGDERRNNVTVTVCFKFIKCFSLI
jgi:hypothetical protein